MEITSIVFYFPPSSPSFLGRDRFLKIIDFFDKKNIKIDFANVSGNDFSSKEMYNYATISSKLLTEIDDVSRVDLYSMLPEFKQYDFGWMAMFSLDKLNGVIYLGFDKKLIDDQYGFFSYFFELFQGGFDIRYGYSYIRTLRNGPFLFSIGMIAGLGFENEDEEEADQITMWLDEFTGDKRYLASHLRNIFDFNILSTYHTEAIRLLKENNVGELKTVRDKWSIWTPDRKSKVKAEKILRQSGLLIC